MTQPRVAAFARLANGNVAPTRVISGQGSKLGRTIHGLVYDAAHDEIFVPNALADAILVFRGDANGEQAPIRVIQGPCTGLVTPHSVSLDIDHDEILVASLNGRRINVFRRNATGNVPPLRMIMGPKTQLGHLVGIAVDPEKNLMAVANSKDILVFNRTDDGNVEPRARIAGPETGISDEPWEMQFYKGKIFLAASNHLHQNLYEEGVKLRPDAKRVPYDPWLNPNLGFIGVWDITANGDRGPELKIGGPFSGLTHPTGLVLNPKNGEIYVSDSAKNDVLMFYLPQFFAQIDGKAGRSPK